MGSQFRSKSSSGHASVRAGFTGDNDRFEKVAHGRDPIPALVEMIRDYPRDALEFFGQSLYGKLSSSDRATVIDTRVLRALCNEVPKYDLDGAVRLERADGSVDLVLISFEDRTNRVERHQLHLYVEAALKLDEKARIVPMAVEVMAMAMAMPLAEKTPPDTPTAATAAKARPRDPAQAAMAWRPPEPRSSLTSIS